MNSPYVAHFSLSASASDVLSAINEMLSQKNEVQKALQLIKDLEVLIAESGEPPQIPPEDVEQRLKYIAAFLEKRKDLDISIVDGRVILSTADPEAEKIAKEILFKDRK